MAGFTIPKSVAAYFQDESLQTAVDSLVQALNGKKMPECDWETARQYNQALLMAAQVRADYMELHFTLWEQTFGKSSAGDLGNPYFDWDETPSCVWEESYLEKSYYRDGSPDDGQRSDSLLVSFEADMVRLEVRRWADDDHVIGFSQNESVEGWNFKMEDGVLFARTKPIPVNAFIKELDAKVLSLQKASDAMIGFLLSR